MKQVNNINYYQDLYMDSFLPDKEEFYTIIHFHGGGLVEGDKGDTHTLCSHLAEAGFAVFTANYHLLPEHKFPSFLYEAAEAVKYVIDNISKFGKSKGFIVSGTSAGAWITLMLCFNKEYLKSTGVDEKKIVGYISESGQPTSHFHILEIEKGLNPLLQRIDECAPLYYVDESIYFSRLLLIAYENDLPNRYEQNELLKSAILSFNKSLDVRLEILDGYHCYGSSELNDDNEYDLVEIIKEWIKK